MKKIAIATCLSAMAFSYVVAKLALLFVASGPTFIMSFGTCLAIIGGSFCGLIVAFTAQGTFHRGIAFGLIFAFPSLVSSGLAIEHHRHEVVEQREMMPLVVASGMFYFNDLDRKHIDMVSKYDLQSAIDSERDPDVAQVFTHMRNNIQLIGHFQPGGYGYVISRGDLLTYPIRLHNATANW
jgi:hypothetical protein